MPFELFVKRNAKGTDRLPGLSINKVGTMSFNAALAKFCAEHHIKRIFLLWDAETSRIGLKPSGDGSHEAFSLCYSSKGNAARFHGGGFLRHIGVDFSAGGRHLDVDISNPEMLVMTVPADWLPHPERAALLMKEPPPKPEPEKELTPEERQREHLRVLEVASGMPKRK